MYLFLIEACIAGYLITIVGHPELILVASGKGLHLFPAICKSSCAAAYPKLARHGKVSALANAVFDSKRAA